MTVRELTDELDGGPIITLDIVSKSKKKIKDEEILNQKVKNIELIGDNHLRVVVY